MEQFLGKNQAVRRDDHDIRRGSADNRHDAGVHWADVGGGVNPLPV